MPSKSLKMCFNPYNNLGDRRIMKRGVNQIRKDESQNGLGK